MAAAAAVVSVASTLYSAYSSRAQQRQADHAAESAEYRALAENAERDRLTAEHTAATIAEAERERAEAIKFQGEQNIRANMLATEAADTEKKVAANIAERAKMESDIVNQDAAREAERVKNLEAETVGRQKSVMASSGVDINASGTANILLLDTKKRTEKDLGLLSEATGSRLNMLQKQADFALEQGDTSARNILKSAEHATKTSMDNVLSAGETLVQNAKIGGQTERSMANLQNLLTLGSASQFREQVDRLKSEANARMWGTLLSGTGTLLSTSKTATSSLSS